MRRAPLLLVAALALSAAGCGDSPQAILRDVITFKNELADEGLRVTDDASAKATREGRLKKMKDRQEWIKSRLDKMKEEKKKVQEFADAAQANAEELEASEAYLKRSADWLQLVGGEASGVALDITSLANFQLPQPPPPPPPKSPGG